MPHVARHTPREASKKQQKTKSSDWRELESDSNSEGLIEEREKENVRRLPNDFLFVFFVLFGFSFSSAPQRELKFICSFVLYCVLFFFLCFSIELCLDVSVAQVVVLFFYHYCSFLLFWCGASLSSFLRATRLMKPVFFSRFLWSYRLEKERRQTNRWGAKMGLTDRTTRASERKARGLSSAVEDGDKADGTSRYLFFPCCCYERLSSASVWLVSAPMSPFLFSCLFCLASFMIVKGVSEESDCCLFMPRL